MLRILSICLFLYTNPLYAQTKPIPNSHENDWTETKIIIVSAGALLGGWVIYTILDGLFVETITIGDTLHAANVPVVNEIESFNGYKLLAATTGSVVSSIELSKFYDENHKTIIDDIYIISETLNSEFNIGLNFIQNKFYDVRDYIQARSYELYDYYFN